MHIQTCSCASAKIDPILQNFMGSMKFCMFWLRNNIFLADFDGLFLSNGPGDPSVCSKTVEHIRQYIESGNETRPVFGICLGHQLLCRALGTMTFKMKLVHTPHSTCTFICTCTCTCACTYTETSTHACTS